MLRVSWTSASRICINDEPIEEPVDLDALLGEWVAASDKMTVIGRLDPLTAAQLCNRINQTQPPRQVKPRKRKDQT